MPLILMAERIARHSALIVGKQRKITDVVTMAPLDTLLFHSAAENSPTDVVSTAQ